MRVRRIIGVVLILAGVLGLIYGGFTLPSERHAVELGNVHLGYSEKRSVSVPTWVDITAIALGALLLVLGPRQAR